MRGTDAKTTHYIIDSDAATATLRIRGGADFNTPFARLEDLVAFYRSDKVKTMPCKLTDACPRTLTEMPTQSPGGTSWELSREAEAMMHSAAWHDPESPLYAFRYYEGRVRMTRTRLDLRHLEILLLGGVASPPSAYADVRHSDDVMN